ncbi:hypothetical protein WA026_015291 [Henosepilachna vigintioctopunctata]|uniref:Uncharacterized protein n=1 Tax=Henosepilachna vigintioctopunctata TaxID=420089 RepID=A0AAW1TWG2_9CUCU
MHRLWVLEQKKMKGSCFWFRKIECNSTMFFEADRFASHKKIPRKQVVVEALPVEENAKSCSFKIGAKSGQIMSPSNVFGFVLDPKKNPKQLRMYPSNQGMENCENNFVITNSNIRSVRNKIDIFRGLLNEHKVDIACIPEHWTFDNCLRHMNLGDYKVAETFYRVDGCYRGVALVVRNGVKFKLTENINNT